MKVLAKETTAMKTFIQSILVAALVITFGGTWAQARSSGYDSASQYMRHGKHSHHKKHGKKKSASLHKGHRDIASVHKKKKKKKKHRHY
jgi:hypothetical protein